MSRRILHITESLARTGVASQLLALSRGLLARGFDVHVVALDGRGSLADEYRASGVSTTELDRRCSHDPIAYLRLHRLALWFRPNVIHTWDGDAEFYGRAVAGAGGAGRVVAGQYRIDPWKGSATWFLERRLAQHTTRFVTNSSVIRNWCVAHGLPAHRFTVIPFGVPPARSSDVSRDVLLRELRLSANSRLIGVVGRLIPEKRVKDLIWAADLLRVLHDNLRLLIIGDGPLRPQLERYARLASDLEHIQFLGERDDVWRIMPHLDVLWNASENRSQSMAILEAMAAGVPVVASDTSLHGELVIEGETGYLIPQHERSGRATRARHTDRIFTDREFSCRLATAASRRIGEHFSVEQALQKYVQMYENAKQDA